MRDAFSLLTFTFLTALQNKYKQEHPGVEMTPDIEDDIQNAAGVSATNFMTLIHRTGNVDEAVRQYGARNPDFAKYFENTLKIYGNAINHPQDARAMFYKNVQIYASRGKGSLNDLKAYGVEPGDMERGNKGNNGLGAWEFRRNLELWSTFTAANSAARMLANAGKDQEIDGEFPVGYDILGKPVTKKIKYSELPKYNQPDRTTYYKDIGDFTTDAHGNKLFAVTYAPADGSTEVQLNITEDEAKKIRDGKTISVQVNGKATDVNQNTLTIVNKTGTQGTPLDPSPKHKDDAYKTVSLRNMVFLATATLYDTERDPGGLLAGSDASGTPKPSFWVLAGRIYKSHGITKGNSLDAKITAGDPNATIDDTQAARDLVQKFGINWDVYDGNPANMLQEMSKRIPITTMAYFQPHILGDLAKAGEGIGWSMIPVVSSCLGGILTYQSQAEWNRRVNNRIDKERDMGASDIMCDSVQAMQEFDLHAARKAMAMTIGIGSAIDLAMLIMFALTPFTGGASAAVAGALMEAKIAIQTAAKMAFKKGLEAAAKQATKQGIKSAMKTAMKTSLKEALTTSINPKVIESLTTLKNQFDYISETVLKKYAAKAAGKAPADIKDYGEKWMNKATEEALKAFETPNLGRKLLNAFKAPDKASHAWTATKKIALDPATWGLPRAETLKALAKAIWSPKAAFQSTKEFAKDNGMKATLKEAGKGVIKGVVDPGLGLQAANPWFTEAVNIGITKASTGENQTMSADPMHNTSARIKKMNSDDFYQSITGG